MLTILGRETSINVRKVLWTCAETGLDFRREDYGTGFADTTTPEFLRLNPNGLIPVLLDDGFTLWESNTICRYLAGKAGRDDLLPGEPAARAGVEQWMDWQATELNPAWRYAFHGLSRRNPDFQDPAAIAASVAAWNRAMAILDGQINATGTWAAGASFTLADIVLGLSVNRWLMTPIERPAFAAIADYQRRLAARDGYRRYSDVA